MIERKRVITITLRTDEKGNYAAIVHVDGRHAVTKQSFGGNGLDSYRLAIQQLALNESGFNIDCDNPFDEEHGDGGAQA